MSGGVDSSVAAAFLKEQGYDVVGVTLQLYDQGELAKKKGACCAGQDIYDARNVADRIGIAHNVPKWGDGGLVISAAGNTLTVDHDLDWSGGTKQILLRKPDGSVTDPITVSRGTRDNKVVLPGAAPTTINYDNDSEYTSFAFGSSTTLVRDFVVVATRPTGENTVTIEAVNYAPDIFTGAMGFLT
jgi:hypothetical protein